MAMTPWGESQDREDIAPGIIFYTTASHGGFRLNPEVNAKVPENYRKYAAAWSHGFFDGRAESVGWYEEDCAALTVVVTFPEHFPEADIVTAQKMLNYYMENPS